MFRRRRLRVQHAVDAIPNGEFLLKGFDVHVARSRLDGFDQDEIDEIDKRRLLRHAVEVVGLECVQVVLKIVVIVVGLTSEQVGHFGSRRAIVPSEEFREQSGLHALTLDFAAAPHGDFVGRFRVERIEHGQNEFAVPRRDWNDAEPHSRLGLHKSDGIEFRFERFLVPRQIENLCSLANGCGLFVKRSGGGQGLFARVGRSGIELCWVSVHWGSVVASAAASTSQPRGLGDAATSLLAKSVVRTRSD